MARASGEKENQSFQSASKLHAAGIPFAIQGGFEAYVPKVRVVLFEAAIAAAHGLNYDAAIESITISPARILGIQDRVGSLEVGKDADLALYDGDPLEYTTHCVGVAINGRVVSSLVR
jgi:imidazolonepropionase-like amidohydrolase